MASTTDSDSKVWQGRASTQNPTKLFQLMTRLGEGSYGEVYNAREIATGRIVAIKVIPVESDLDQLGKEIDILRRCQSPYIVSYFGSYVHDHNLWIVMEYCGGGSAADVMQACSTVFSEEMIAEICASVLLGLVYLHRNHNIHRDIKAGNVLLSPEGRAKLADFGVSAQLNNTMSKRRTVIGTPFWMAPEVIQQTDYDSKADVWSLGITTIEIGEGKPPYADIHPMRAIFMIPGKPPPTFEDPSKFSADCQDFVKQCLVKKVADRPTAHDMLSHKFVAAAVKRLQASDGVSPLLAELLESCAPQLQKFREKTANEAGPETLVRPRATMSSQHSDESVVGTSRFNDVDPLMHSDTMVLHGSVDFDTGTMVAPSGTMVAPSGTMVAPPTGTIVMRSGAPAATPSFMDYNSDDDGSAPSPAPAPTPATSSVARAAAEAATATPVAVPASTPVRVAAATMPAPSTVQAAAAATQSGAAAAASRTMAGGAGGAAGAGSGSDSKDGGDAAPKAVDVPTLRSRLATLDSKFEEELAALQSAYLKTRSELVQQIRDRGGNA